MGTPATGGFGGSTRLKRESGGEGKCGSEGEEECGCGRGCGGGGERKRCAVERALDLNVSYLDGSGPTCQTAIMSADGKRR